MSQCLVIDELDKEQLKTDIPVFRIGDTLSVHTRIIEGSKERIQVFTGTVIARRGKGLSETVALYRVSYGSGMERVFTLHSPKIAKLEVARSGKTRRAKLYHLRGSFGKASKVEEKIYTSAKPSSAPKSPSTEDSSS